MSPEISSSTPPTESLKRINTDTSTDRPTLNCTSKTPDRDTMSCCSPCLQGLWRPIRNFFIAIWNFFCCKCRNNPSETETIPEPIQFPRVEDGSRNWADGILKNRYENTEKPHYKGLDQTPLLISPAHRYLYIEFLLEITDVEYEPKRTAIPIDTIQAIISRIGLRTVEDSLRPLCEACATDKNYDALRKKLKELDNELRPPPPNFDPPDVKGP